MNALLVAGTLLAQGPRAPLEPEDVKPGWVALVIVLLMAVATYLLWRSMNRQLKKVNFDDGVRREGDNRNGEDGAKTP